MNGARLKTTTAYLASLGATAILIAFVLVALVLGTGVVAFHSLPEAAESRVPLDRVVIKDRPSAELATPLRAKREPRRRG